MLSIMWIRFVDVAVTGLSSINPVIIKDTEKRRQHINTLDLQVRL